MSRGGVLLTRPDHAGRADRPGPPGRPGVAVEVFLVAAALLGAVAVGRLAVGGPWTSHAVPLVVTAAVGAAVPAVLLRLGSRQGSGRRPWTTRRHGDVGRTAPLLAAPLGTMAVLLVATWTTVGNATLGGLPTPTTVRVLRRELGIARAALHGFHLPVAPRPGVGFLAAVLVGVGAVAARLLLAGRTLPTVRSDSTEPSERATRGCRWPLMAMLPSTALVAWSVAVVGGTGADLLAAVAVGVAAAAVLADQTPTPHPANPLPGAAPAVKPTDLAPVAPTADPGRLRATARRLAGALGRHAERGAAGWSLVLGAIGAALLLATLVGTSVPVGSVAVGHRVRGSGGARARWPPTAGAGQHNPGAGHGNQGGAARAPVPPTAVSLATDLLGVEAEDPTVPLFTATSPIPTYWQVATLSRFESGRWSADPATLGALRSGTVPPQPNVLPGAGRATFVARVTLDRFSSRLLPVPPDTLAVSLAGEVAVTGAGAVAPSPLPAGVTYQLTAAVPPSITAGSPSLAGPASSLGSPLPLAAQLDDLSVPGLPVAVRSLAEHVTAGATTPLARAEALEDWFRSGRFRYHLALPSPGDLAHPGAALVQFLEHTRAGSCQDFAGAYAAMARAVGLPARVAVGFTAGRRLAPTARTPAGFVTSLVRGTDAHAWPEVYLGADLGWLSFEPTPSRPAGQLAPEGIVGPSARSTNPVSPPVTTPTGGSTAPSTPPTAPVTTQPTTPVTRALGGGSGHHAHRSSAGTGASGAGGLSALGWSAVTLAAVVLLLLLALYVLPYVLAGVTFPAERRRRRLVRTEPSLATLDAYRSAQRSLVPVGLAALPTDSPVLSAERSLAAAEAIDEGASGERSARPVRELSDAEQLLGALRDAVALAHALELVCFASLPATGERAADGYRRASRIRRALRRRGVRTLARDLSAHLAGAADPVRLHSPRTGRSTSPV